MVLTHLNSLSQVPQAYLQLVKVAAVTRQSLTVVDIIVFSIPLRHAAVHKLFILSLDSVTRENQISQNVTLNQDFLPLSLLLLI